MFCPRCGSPVTMLADGSATCSRTGALLAREFLEELESCSVSAEEPRSARPLTCDPEGAWFCRDCGCRMLRRPGFVDCPRCGRGLSGFVNASGKLSPHP